MLNRFSKRTKIIGLGLVSLIAVFTISYVVTDVYLNKRHNTDVVDNEKKVSASNSDELKDSVKIQFYTGDTQDSEKTVKEYKKEKDLKELSYLELVNLVSKEGYDVSSNGNETISFKRDKNQTLQSGKYYLGFKDSKLAIFKGVEGNKLEFVEEAEHLEGEPVTKADIISSRDKKAADEIENNQISSETLEGIREEASDY